MTQPREQYSTWYKIQSYFNALNHVMNGAVACFMTLYLIREGRDKFSWHVFLTTIGYQLLMAEAIMVFYTPNSLTYFHSHKVKKHLHWILQLIGAVCIITGNVIITVIRTTPHFETLHAITGKAKSFARSTMMKAFSCFRSDLNGVASSVHSPGRLGLLRTSLGESRASNNREIFAQPHIYFVLHHRHGEPYFWLQIRFNTRSLHNRRG